TLVRHLLGRKIDTLLRRAALVTAGSAYLAKRAKQAGARRVEIVPTVVDFAEYVNVPPRTAAGFTVGWVGSPATQGHLQSVASVLSDLLNEHGDRFITIGARFPRKLFERHDQLDWRKDTEVSQLAQLDVGIMPLPDGPFERGKCGYKLIQYMASGLPVIT